VTAVSYLVLGACLLLGPVGCSDATKQGATDRGPTQTSAVVAQPAHKKPASSLPHDLPLIVWSRSIGDVRLGMTSAAVKRKYGSPRKSQNRGSGEVFATYVVHRGASLWVTYLQRRVVSIETTSPYYVTETSAPQDAVHVDSLVRAYQCYLPTYQGACEPALLGFQWADNCQAWVLRYKGLVNFVGMAGESSGSTKRYVDNIGMGSPRFTLASCL
jgi:hypothetical protein